MLSQPMELVGSGRGTLLLQPLSVTSTAGKSPREGGSGAGGEVSTPFHSILGCQEHGRPCGVLRGTGCLCWAWSPQNPRGWAGNTPAGGVALGISGELLEALGGKSQPFPAVFQCPFAPRNALLAGGQQERTLWWELGTAGGASGQEFGAGTPAAAAFLALPALPSPGLRCREPSSPRSGTLAFVSENKVSAVTQPVAIPAIPASTFTRQRGSIPAWGLPRKIRTGGTGTGTGSTMVAGMAVGPWLPRDGHLTLAVRWCLSCIPSEPIPSTGHQSPIPSM